MVLKTCVNDLLHGCKERIVVRQPPADGPEALSGWWFVRRNESRHWPASPCDQNGLAAESNTAEQVRKLFFRFGDVD
jgi:hypothetical protein